MLQFTQILKILSFLSAPLPDNGSIRATVAAMRRLANSPTLNISCGAGYPLSVSRKCYQPPWPCRKGGIWCDRSAAVAHSLLQPREKIINLSVEILWHTMAATYKELVALNMQLSMENRHVFTLQVGNQPSRH